MGRLLVLSALTSVVWLPAAGQSVISARSGVVHLLEGAVFIDGQSIAQKPGRFQELKDGSELRTEKGRAEVLLTPGAFLRLGENSAIRMVSNRLSDTKVEFLKGSAVLEAADDASAAPISISFGDCQVSFKKQGRYRLDSDPAELKVYKGEAEAIRNGKPTKVGESFVLPMTSGEVAEKNADPATDSLDNWDQTRNNAIAEDNAQAAHTDDFSGAVDTYPDGADPTIQSFWVSLVGPYNGYAPYGGIMPLGFATYGLWGFSPWIPLGIYANPELRFSYFAPFSTSRVGGFTGLPGISHLPGTPYYRYTSPYGRATGGYHYVPRTSVGIGTRGVGAVHAAGHR